MKLRAEDGKLRLTDVADTEQLFRIIQSVPSPKAEPFKQWMAHVASERIDQLQDPELSIQYATLTDIIYQHWAGKTAKEYKQFKGLKKENLRDNMTNEELVLNMLAELSTTSITKSKNPQTLEDNMQCAADGGDVARVAREQLEAKTGRKVVSPLSTKRFFEGQKDQGLIADEENNE